MNWTRDDVAELRSRLGLGVGDFAKLVGVDPRSVHRWESGAARPTGTAEAVLNGIREGLERPDGQRVATVIISAAAVGGLAYLLVRSLEAAASAPSPTAQAA
jgi:predicted transcriptional regulator